MRGIDHHYSPEGTVTFSVTKAKYSRVVLRALKLINSGEEQLVASSILRRNGVVNDEDLPKEVVFTDEDCPLILSGIQKFINKACQAPGAFQDQGAFLAHQATRVADYISQAVAVEEIIS